MASSSQAAALPAPTLPLRPAVLAALGALYLIWGSTYFAMKVALVTMPPLLMAGLRFSVAGAVLFATLRLTGRPAPCLRGWAASAIVGALLLGVGNGAIAFAQQWVSSGMAAVVASTIPIWTASFSALDGRRPSAREAVGLALGLAGVVVLNLGGEITAHGPWAMVVLLGPAGFALGSVWSRRLPLPDGAMAAAAEMLCAGGLLLLFGLVRGERLTAVPDGSAMLAVGYLVVFGSLVGLTAYNFLLRETAPVVATSYAYVNPLVAVGLGVLLGGEMVGPATWVAGGVIILGVGLITTGRRIGNGSGNGSGNGR